MRHSRLPWIVETGPYSGNDWLIGSAINGKDYSITTDHVHASAMNSADAEDDAKFIVEACNNYEAVLAQRDELLEACKAVLEAWGSKDIYYDYAGYSHHLPSPAIDPKWIMQVRSASAIAKAEQS